MEEKVTQMQRQLDAAQKQLQAANQALAGRLPEETLSTSGAPAAAAAGELPSRAEMEAAYTAAAREFTKKLEAQLGEFRIESCHLHSVQGPHELYPFTSQISFAFTALDGKTFITDIPVKADLKGRWVFPAIEEVVQRVTSEQRMASGEVPQISNAPATSGRDRKAEQPRLYMPVDGTITIHWPQSNPAAPAGRTGSPPANSPTVSSRPPDTAAATPTAAPRPQPQSAAAPSAAPVMRVDRDIQIQFTPPP